MKSLIKKSSIFCGLVSFALSLSGCEQTKEAFGLTKSNHDEFLASERLPLSYPPHFGLEAPQPGGPSAKVPQPEEMAKAALSNH